MMSPSQPPPSQPRSPTGSARRAAFRGALSSPQRHSPSRRGGLTFASPSSYDDDVLSVPSVALTDASFASSSAALSDAEIHALRSINSSAFDSDSDSDSDASSDDGVSSARLRESILDDDADADETESDFVGGVGFARADQGRGGQGNEGEASGRQRQQQRWSRNSLLAAASSRASARTDAEYRLLQKAATADTAELTTDERGNLKKMCSHVDETEFVRQYLSVLFCGMGEVLDCNAGSSPDGGAGSGLGRSMLKNVLD